MQTVRLMIEKLEDLSVLKVWVQPEAWDGADDTRPTTEFEITASSTSGGWPVPPDLALSQCAEQPWGVTLSIAQTARSDAEARASLAGALQRQFRAWALPDGVDMASAPAFWAGIDHGGARARAEAAGRSPPEPAPFDPMLFREPSGNIIGLRQMAKEGKEKLEKLEEEERGKKKVVWGRLEDLDGEREARVAEELAVEDGKEAVDEMATETSTVRTVADAVSATPEDGLQSVDRVLDDALRLYEAELEGNKPVEMTERASPAPGSQINIDAATPPDRPATSKASTTRTD
jgi:hypothetical protein